MSRTIFLTQENANTVATLAAALRPIIPAGNCEGVLTTAVEGGISYWANDYRGLKVTRGPDGFVTGLYIGQPRPGSEAHDVPPICSNIEARDVIEAVAWCLIASSAPGIPTHARVSPATAGRFLGQLLDKDGCDLDAGDCDVLLQVAVFQRVVYG